MRYLILIFFILSWTAKSDVSTPSGTVPTFSNFDFNRNGIYELDKLYLSDDSANTMLIQAPELSDDNTVVTMPATNGNADEVIETDGSGNLSYTKIQNANVHTTAGIIESKLTLDYATTTLNSNLNDHMSDTTTHGTTGNIVGTSDEQTLTNKDLTNPSVNTIDYTWPNDNGAASEVLTTDGDGVLTWEAAGSSGELQRGLGSSSLYTPNVSAFNPVGESSMAIGANATTGTSASSIAFGSSASVSNAHNNSVAIGYNAQTLDSNQIMLGNYNHTVVMPNIYQHGDYIKYKIASGTIEYSEMVDLVTNPVVLVNGIAGKYFLIDHMELFLDWEGAGQYADGGAGTLFVTYNGNYTPISFSPGTCIKVNADQHCATTAIEIDLDLTLYAINASLKFILSGGVDLSCPGVCSPVKWRLVYKEIAILD